ncbi:MAG: GTP cyclohydrolase I FolE [Candidatus Margulisbacteria bacterium GWF2_35_9]|nr:MAG: GTP cyclohydrolase I FolE [Candidatus Margulisbacteria bacterium GWF2_35_9]
MNAKDIQTIEQAITMILGAIGEDPSREGLIETPKRIAKMYQEIFAGINADPKKHIKLFHEENHQEMVIVRAIPFYSMCEHHMLPFFGTADIAYIPTKKITGISKMARIIDTFAKRLQLQERLTSQVANFIMDNFDPQGVMVVVRAEHLCMSMRGVEKPGTSIVTSAVRGVFDSDSKTRNEALSLFKI